MTVLHTLASGSSGNAALIRCGSTHILLDAGISCRRITAALRGLGLAPEDLSAVLITHSHSDHVQGLQTICKRWDVPICATHRTARDLACRIPGAAERLRPFDEGASFTVGGVCVTSFPTSHDAPGCCGYRVGDAGFLTDSGYVTDEAAEVLQGVPLLMLEANHDVETLRSGPYPYYLKQRILGAQGHLSNDDAAAFARAAAQSGTRRILLAHLSRENNTPAMAQNAVALALASFGEQVQLSVAPREEISQEFVAEEAVCRR